ncbi:MAG: prepilin-type N-terminal cleavage/methylation domain-containing protein [Verrucomicrobiota bacterium]
MNSRRGGFTLVEIMIVVAIIALLAAIAVPGFLRARKRSQATTLLNNLRLLDAAKDQYSIEFNKTLATPNGGDLKGYFKTSSALYNAISASASATNFADPKIQGVTYYLNTTDQLPSIGTGSAFSDVVDTSFWSPYTAQ